MATLLKAVVVGIVTIIWVVVGFYLWIPALIVASLAYAVGLILAAFFDDSPMKDLTEEALEAATNMYRSGFRKIWQVATKPQSEEEKKKEPSGCGMIFFAPIASVVALGLATGVWWLLFIGFRKLSPFISR
jgi:hypothetical protein